MDHWWLPAATGYLAGDVCGSDLPVLTLEQGAEGLKQLSVVDIVGSFAGTCPSRGARWSPVSCRGAEHFSPHTVPSCSHVLYVGRGVLLVCSV